MYPPNVCVAIVLLTVIHVVALYDGVALMFWGHAYTVSYVVKSWSGSFPIIPLIVGLVIGHLFWPVGSANNVTPNESIRNGKDVAATDAKVDRAP